jgi:polyhydroxyalkanoate synthesis regulator phasin
MKKSFYFLISFSLFFALFVFAEEDLPPDVTFPIAELGNCGSKLECQAYCDLPENMEACLDYAEAHNLIPPEEIEMARKMLALGVTAGPGGCRGQNECQAYCDDINHIEECLDFALKYDLIPPAELEEARKVAQAIKQGIKPPNCRGKDECDIYCNQAEHFEECLNFATAAGLIPPDEIEEAQMVLRAIKKGVKPPNCRGKEECDIYCSQPAHLEECLTFAEAAGFISPEEAEMARKTGGRGPGDCRSEEECQAYCENPANLEECLEFAVMIGEMTAEEAAKALRGGPGGCRTQEECETYCQDPAHFEECLWAAVESGEMSTQEAQQIINQMKMQEEMEHQMREEREQQMQQEMERQMEQELMPEEMIPEIPIQEMPEEIIPPPTEEGPQSLLNQWQKFLASLISTFGL